MALTDRGWAGACIFVGAVQFALLETLAEIYYPGYSVSANYISDLGATCPGGGAPCVIYQPTATIFDVSVAVLGLFLLAAAYFLQRSLRWKPLTIMIGLTGVGALGVGLFPETSGVVHSVFSLIAFLFAGLSAIVAARLQRRPLSFFSVVLGVITLAALVLFVGGSYLGLGAGGMERLVVYPVLFWSIGFGAYLMGNDQKTPM